MSDIFDLFSFKRMLFKKHQSFSILIVFQEFRTTLFGLIFKTKATKKKTGRKRCVIVTFIGVVEFRVYMFGANCQLVKRLKHLCAERDVNKTRIFRIMLLASGCPFVGTLRKWQQRFYDLFLSFPNGWGDLFKFRIPFEN